MSIKYKEGNDQAVVITNSIVNLVMDGPCTKCEEDKPTILLMDPHVDSYAEDGDYDMVRICLDCLSVALEELEEAQYENEEG